MPTSEPELWPEKQKHLVKNDCFPVQQPLCAWEVGGAGRDSSKKIQEAGQMEKCAVQEIWDLIVGDSTTVVSNCEIVFLSL